MLCSRITKNIIFSTGSRIHDNILICDWLITWLLSEGAWLANSTTTIITPLPQGIPNDRCRQLLSPTESPRLNSQVKSTDRRNHRILNHNIWSHSHSAYVSWVSPYAYLAVSDKDQHYLRCLGCCDLHPVSPVKSHVQDLFSQGNETSFLEKNLDLWPVECSTNLAEGGWHVMGLAVQHPSTSLDFLGSLRIPAIF